MFFLNTFLSLSVSQTAVSGEKMMASHFLYQLSFSTIDKKGPESSSSPTKCQL